MNYIKKSILSITIFSFVISNLFAAGARVHNGTGGIISFNLLTPSGPKGRLINPGKTEEINAGAFVAIDGAEWLYCGKIYRVNIQRIEGAEGWRDWNLQGDGKTIEIGPWGLLAAFGNITANVTEEGSCPCDLGSALKQALK